MTVGQGGPPRVFISYSHDSLEHSARVLTLANRLRREGIDCQVDAYQMAPHEGWPRWMEGQIAIADYVLVVCTETYARRVEGHEEPGVGLGAIWEGAIITRELYEGGGLNAKFIPVVFNTGDIAHIPGFLRTTTRYDLSNDDGYEGLYRRVTEQPRTPAPDLGDIRKLPGDRPDTTGGGSHALVSPLILFVELNGQLHVATLLELHAEAVIRARVQANDADTRAFLDGLDRSAGPIGVAFQDTAVLARASAVTRHVEGGSDYWQLEFAPEETDYGAGFMEMSTTRYSADDLAELRARRILLDESSDSAIPDGVPQHERSFLEVLIRGQSSPLQPAASPLVPLYAELGERPELFLAVARLVSILWLRLSGVVEHVLELELSLVDDELAVRFRGRRQKKYSNVEPIELEVTGRLQVA